MSRARARQGRLGLGGAAATGGGLSAAALAPMVDMMTILVVAVLRTWSSDPPAVLPDEPGFRLPVSAQETPPTKGITIDIGAEGLYVDGWRAGSATFWRDSDEILVTDLYDTLQRLKGQQVTIRAHESAPWALVGKILYTARQAGYDHVELIAVSRVSL